MNLFIWQYSYLYRIFEIRILMNYQIWTNYTVNYDMDNFKIMEFDTGLTRVPGLILMVTKLFCRFYCCYSTWINITNSCCEYLDKLQKFDMWTIWLWISLVAYINQEPWLIYCFLMVMKLYCCFHCCFTHQPYSYCMD